MVGRGEETIADRLSPHSECSCVKSKQSLPSSSQARKSYPRASDSTSKAYSPTSFAAMFYTSRHYEPLPIRRLRERSSLRTQTHCATSKRSLKRSPFGEFYTGLAKSWIFSKDRLAITFTLREGIAFHSGKALDTRRRHECHRRQLVARGHRKSLSPKHNGKEKVLPIVRGQRGRFSTHTSAHRAAGAALPRNCRPCPRQWPPQIRWRPPHGNHSILLSSSFVGATSSFFASSVL